MNVILDKVEKTIKLISPPLYSRMAFIFFINTP